MSLRRKLTLFFVVIVMLPLLAAAVVVHSVVVGEVKDRAEIALQPALNTVLAGYNGRVPSIDSAVEQTLSSPKEVGKALAGGDRRLEQFLSRQIGSSEAIGCLIVLNENGRPIGFATTDSQFAKGFAEPTPREIAQAAIKGSRGGPGFVVSNPIEIKLKGGKRTFSIVGGFW